jgi:hypothetical protein
MRVCKKCGAEDYRTAPESCMLCGTKYEPTPHDPKFDTNERPDPKFDTHKKEDDHGVTEYDRISNFGCW